MIEYKYIIPQMQGEQLWITFSTDALMEEMRGDQSVLLLVTENNRVCYQYTEGKPTVSVDAFLEAAEYIREWKGKR